MAKLVRDDEEQLIARSQRGDVEAFNQLILRYQQTTYGVVYRMLGNPDVAADVTQDALLAAFRAIHSFRGGSSFRSGPPPTGSNMSCRHWRNTQPHPPPSFYALTHGEEPPPPPATWAVGPT